MNWWSWRSRIGTFRITYDADIDRWIVWFEDENLGPYISPEAALDDLVGGHTWHPSSGVDPSTLDIPDDFSGWTEHSP